MKFSTTSRKPSKLRKLRLSDVDSNQVSQIFKINTARSNPERLNPERSKHESLLKGGISTN